MRTVSDIIYRDMDPSVERDDNHLLKDHLGLDSLEITDMHIAIEDALNIHILDSEVDEWETVLDVLNTVSMAINRKVFE